MSHVLITHVGPFRMQLAGLLRRIGIHNNVRWSPPVTNSSSDIEAELAAAEAGDEAALAALFDTYRDRLLRMVNLRLDRRLSRRVDPVDVVQETFLVVQRKFPAAWSKSKLPFFVWLRLEAGKR